MQEYLEEKYVFLIQNSVHNSLFYFSLFLNILFNFCSISSSNLIFYLKFFKSALISLF